MLTPSESREQGFTLIELMVVIAILSVIGGVVVASVVRALEVTTQANERTNALTDIERGLERVTRQIRVADPLLIDPDKQCDSLSLSATECETQVLQRRLDALSYANNQLVQNSYYLDTSSPSVELQQDVTITDPDTGNIVADSTGQFIADIANLKTGTPLFRFLAPDSVSGELTEITCGDLGATEADVDECRSRYATASVVEMTLSKVLTDSTPLTASTAVNIRNTRFDP